MRRLWRRGGVGELLRGGKRVEVRGWMKLQTWNDRAEHQYTNHNSIRGYLQGIPGNGYAYWEHVKGLCLR
jgi:hypothetical protein